jgi:uncharacterized protein (TIGR03437 family)
MTMSFRYALLMAPGLLATRAAIAQTPTFNASGVVNSASFQPSLAPGAQAAIFGQNLSNGACRASALPLPATLCDTQVTVGGRAAPLLFASPGQLTLQIPFEVPIGAAEVVVRVQGRSSASVTVDLDTFAPGLYSTTPAGQCVPFAVATHATGALVTMQSPGQPGEILSMQAVGLGRTNPAVASGAAAPASPPAVTVGQPTVAVGSLEASVLFSGLTPGLAGGVYQVNFRLPANLPGGNLPLTLHIGRKDSNTVMLPVSGIVQTPAPVIQANRVVNIASAQPSLSPGVQASIFGQNLSFGSNAARTAPLPAMLCAAQVTVGGKAASLLFASPGQLNVQIPSELEPGPAQVVVQVQGRSSAPVTVQLEAFAPGLFTTDQGVGVVLHATGSAVTPQSPAQPGETLALQAVGLGPTNPAVATGAAAPASPPVATVTQPAITVGCQQAPVLFSGLTPGLVGLYQVNFTLPASAPGGNLPLTVTIGGKRSNPVTLPVSGLAIPVVNNVVNGASFASAPVAAPGTILSVFGCNFGARDNLSAFPATDFQGTSVTFNGVAAPLFAVAASANQINVLAPTELPESGTIPVQVKTSTGAGANFTLTMSSATPGIFRIPDPSKPTRQNAAALLANTAWRVMPSSMAAALGFPTNCAANGVSAAATCGQPAKEGDIVSIFVTGLGKATPGGDPNGRPLSTGSVAPADGSVVYQTVAVPAVSIGGVAAQVLFSGLAPGFGGLYQINVQVPAGVAPGDDVVVRVSMPNGATDSATIAVAP